MKNRELEKNWCFKLDARIIKKFIEIGQIKLKNSARYYMKRYSDKLDEDSLITLIGITKTRSSKHLNEVHH